MTGSENAKELNKKLIEKMVSDNEHELKTTEKINNKLKSLHEKNRNKLVKILVELGFNDINSDWFGQYDEQD